MWPLDPLSADNLVQLSWHFSISLCSFVFVELYCKNWIRIPQISFPLCELPFHFHTLNCMYLCVCVMRSLNDLLFFFFFFPVFVFRFLGDIFLFFLKFLFIYLFMAALGLCFCVRAFSCCSKWGPLFIAVRGPLTIVASLVVEHRLQTRRLSSCGSRA